MSSAAMKPELEIAILAGGLSHEREVSLRSGRRVAESLRSAGHQVSVRDVDANLLAELRRERPDVVWPLLHGSTGEDGSIRDLLELVGVPRSEERRVGKEGGTTGAPGGSNKKRAEEKDINSANGTKGLGGQLG